LITGIGTDLIEVSRIAAELAKGGSPDFRESLFTSIEIEYCDSKAHRAEHYAARFAAKEAFFKALGTGWRDGLRWTEVEIVNDHLGKPTLNVHGKVRECVQARRITGMMVSLSHIKETASAVVVLEQ
jgi:holo-[acyl-carrier protein] synthase